MRFIGNKEKLALIIFELLEQIGIIKKSKTFFDVFAGSASMGKFFKQRGLQIYSCDLLYFSYCMQRAYLTNNDKSNYAVMLEYLNNIPLKEGFIYQNYAPSGSKKLGIERKYFSDENAMKIDSMRLEIEGLKNTNTINENEYFILLATLIESVSLFANVAGVYAAFCKQWDKRALKPFYLKKLELLESKQEHYCFCTDSIGLLENFKDKSFDILYVDPPYNHRQYAPNYHILETIARYDSPPIKGIAGLREWQGQKSLFCNAKSALDSLERLAKLKNYRILALSYNSEGLMQKEQITELLKSFGTLHFEEFNYPRFKSNNTSAQKFIKEYLWILERNS